MVNKPAGDEWKITTDSCEAATAAAVRAGTAALTTIERAENYKAQLNALFECGFGWNEETCELIDLGGARPSSLVDPDTGLWDTPGEGVLPVVAFIEEVIDHLCVLLV